MAQKVLLLGVNYTFGFVNVLAGTLRQLSISVSSITTNASKTREVWMKDFFAMLRKSSGVLNHLTDKSAPVF